MKSKLRLASYYLFMLAFGLEWANSQAGLPAGFVSTTLATNLIWPTRMAFLPDGRLLILEQGGKIRVLKNGQLLSTPFVSVKTNDAVVSNAEEGLLGLAIDPNFSQNGYVYLYYTIMSPMHQRISRFKALGDIADPGQGETVILDLENGGCHCGGALEFGEDGKLYAGTGDGYDGANAQSLSSLKGKILRMNPIPGAEAQVPTDNPFYSQTTGSFRLIWALGLRNPFSIAFQPLSSRLLINDVGSAFFEEINEGKSSKNYGWPNTEGDFSPSQFPLYTRPLLAYQRTGTASTVGSLIVSGAFYNPALVQFPKSYQGKYFFSDYGFESWIRYLDPDSPTASTEFLPNRGGGNYLDLKIGPDGSLYYLTRSSSGSLVRISYGAPNRLEPQIPFNGVVMEIRPVHKGGDHSLTLVYSLPDPKKIHNIRFTLLDIQGQTLASLNDLPHAQGRHSISLKPTNLRHGIYLAKMVIGQQTYARRLFIPEE